MSDRIDHAAEARKHIDWAHEQQSQEGDMGNVPRDNALLAQAEATLALVEQQRIANLIAMYSGPDDFAIGLARAGVDFAALPDRIAEGLGL